MIVVPLLLDPNLDLIVPLNSKKRPSFGAGSKMKIDAHTLELYKPFLTGTQRTQQTQQSRQKKRLRGFDTASETKQSSEGTFFTNTFISSLIERIVSMDNMGNSPLNKNTDFEFLYPASQKRDKGNNNSTVGCVYTCWLKYFLECNLSSLGSTQSQNISFDLDPEHLLEICLRKPNVFTRFILKTFCKFDPSLKEAISPFLHYQRKMFLDSLLSSKPNTSNQQMVDLPSLFSELEEYQSQLTTRIDSFNSISKYGSMSTHPLGILPNGQLSVLELPSSINLDESSSDSDN
ncbi:hypothetical protein AX774_g5649 [Zancudomyces culisetae]|uniref:Uncharacterized protein n=1 Tax=Zancudomyces culisetae TaxID=1213189 RepID=A0A1R1PIV0_ZANCU|nr:hypothetical protein AX774_g5649 [Zancudomyces culisetae]|eukprot:OMH80900.1 hypothetical protein AX774_g5649 [Zancudomyces culisetae]